MSTLVLIIPLDECTMQTLVIHNSVSHSLAGPELRLRDTVLISHAIINLYTKHWAVSAENFGISFREVKTLCNRIYGLF